MLGMFFTASAPLNAQAMIALAGLCTVIAINFCYQVTVREHPWSQGICFAACIVCVIGSLSLLCVAYDVSPIIRDTPSSKNMVVLLLSLSVGLIVIWFLLVCLQKGIGGERNLATSLRTMSSFTSQQDLSAVHKRANDPVRSRTHEKQSLYIHRGEERRHYDHAPRYRTSSSSDSERFESSR